MTWIAVRRQLGKLAVCGGVLILFATAMAQLARLNWLPELFSHFRPQYLLASLTLACVLLVLGRRRFALLMLVCAIPNAWYVAPYLLPTVVPASVAQAAGKDVAVVSLNLHYRNRQFPVVREYLERSNADLMVLSELTPEWVNELRPLTDKYPHWMSMDRRSPWGLGVYSRYPLLDAHATDLGIRGSVNVVATLALPGGNVRLVAVHLASPVGPTRAAVRNRQLAALSALLGPPAQNGEVPRLLVGDMNVTPFSPYFTDFLAQTGMKDPQRVLGLQETWPTWMPPLRISIDHCIADPRLEVTRAARGPDVGSDHYPLEIRLRQRG